MDYKKIIRRYFLFVLALFFFYSIADAKTLAFNDTSADVQAAKAVHRTSSTPSPKAAVYSNIPPNSTPVTAASDTDDTNEPLELAKQVPTEDPLEGFNRIMFKFNDSVDRAILKPVATLYNKIMPHPLNQGVHNFYNNIYTIPTIINDLLQLRFQHFAHDLWRFTINSTIGIGGFIDVASRMQLELHKTDFGLTLAKYGYKKSTYLVLPFYGPYTIRDGLIGAPVDYWGFSIFPYVEPDSARYALYGGGVIDNRAQLLKYQDVIEEAAVDRYVFVRNAYLQRRNSQIENGDEPIPSDLRGQDAQVADSTNVDLEPLQDLEPEQMDKTPPESTEKTNNKSPKK